MPVPVEGGLRALVEGEADPGPASVMAPGLEDEGGHVGVEPVGHLPDEGEHVQDHLGFFLARHFRWLPAPASKVRASAQERTPRASDGLVGD